MADLSDVENAMVQVIAEALALGSNYISGSTVSSTVAMTPCRVYRGWPKSSILNHDLAQGTTTITVFPVAGSTRRTTRYLPQWKDGPPSTASMTASVQGNLISFSGNGRAAGQVAAVRLGAVGNGRIYAYRLQPGDAPNIVASAIGGLIPGAAVSGNSIAVPSQVGLSAAIGVDKSVYMETRRQAQNMWVTIWSSDPRARDRVTNAVDDGFANMTDQWGRLTYSMGLPDGSWGDIRYISSHTDDAPQQDNLWRRDLRYSVDYPTTISAKQPVVMAIGGTLTVYDTDIVVEFGSEQS